MFHTKRENCGLGTKGKIVALGQMKILVDLAKAEVTTLILPDEYQAISILEGQPFINSLEIIMMVKDNHVHLKMTLLIFLITSCSKDENCRCRLQKLYLFLHFILHIFMLKVTKTTKIKYFLIYAFALGIKQNVLCRGVSSIHKEFYASQVIRNFLQVIVRGEPCLPEDDIKPVNNFLITTSSQMCDLNDRTDNNIREQDKNDVLVFLIQYQDYFSQNMAELVKNEFD